MDDHGYSPLGDYDFSKEIREMMYQHATRLVLPDKNIILYPGDIPDCVYYIEEGKVILGLWGEDGEERYLEILGTNNFFALPSMITNIPDRIFAITDGQTTLYKLKKEPFLQLMKESELFNNVMFQFLAAMTLRMVVLIESLAFKHCKDRIYNLLWYSRNATKKMDEKWYELKYQYTQNDIARVIGASRFTVSRNISKLCEEGSLRIINHNIQVSDKK